jgi:lysophospholipase L1-like esterase
MKIKITALITAFALLLSFTACNDSNTLSESRNEANLEQITSAPEPETEHEPEIIIELEPLPEPETMEEHIAVDSLISTGNNTRIKNAIEKARNGELVHIAAIGGSITEGAGAKPNTNCYAYQFYEKFTAEYASGDGSHIKFANAGMAGTPSNLGWIRYQRDVHNALGGNPDILIIEFAVNDSEDRSFGTDGAAYESMVYDVLNLPNAPAVILMFSVFPNNNMVLQSRYIPVGEGYQLPMVSIGNGTQQWFNNGEMERDDFFADQFHPNNFGHQLMADALMHCIMTIDREPSAESDLTIPPEPVINNGRSYSGMVSVLKGNALPNGLVIDEGSFTETDTSLYRLEYNNQFSFPENWRRNGDSGNEPFVIEVTSKNFLLVYKSGNGMGDADIFVNNEKVRTEKAGGGWNNAITVQLFNEPVAENRRIEIHMAEGSEDKAFTILGFGYTT